MNISNAHRYALSLIRHLLPGLLLVFLVAGAKGQSIYTSGPISVAGSIGVNGDYPTLSAAFNSIGSISQAGASIIITVNGSTTEPSSGAMLNAGNWAAVTLFPTGPYAITGDLPAALVHLNGADNVTIDGRINQTGAKELQFVNYDTGITASTLKFSNSAQNNTINYCFISGGSANTTGGIVYFGGSVIGSGNNGNILSNNSIMGLSETNRPVNAVYSVGSASIPNNNINISNNEISGFLNPVSASNGIYVGAYSLSWTISGNSFYETTLFAPTMNVDYSAIRINNISGNGFLIENNIIGGSAAGGSGFLNKSGSANNAFFGIYLRVGNTANVNSVQGNTIKNINWANSMNANWTGIHVETGQVSIGTVVGNSIGSGIGTDIITVTFGTSSTTIVPGGVFGINYASALAGSIRNNTIGGITTGNLNSGFSCNFYGIAKTAGYTATPLNIRNNLVGSLVTPGSIRAVSPSADSLQVVYGIYYHVRNVNLGYALVANNTIANLINNTTNLTTDVTAAGGRVGGIYTYLSGNVITGNTIRDLYTSSRNVNSGRFASVIGIMARFADFGQEISGNTIYNLSNTSTAQARAIGLYFHGSQSLNNRVSGNFIHSLSVSTSTSGPPFGEIYGIRVNYGAATYANNIISLGTGVSASMYTYGIYEPGTVGNSCNLYHNSVFIGGVSNQAECNSYAFFSGGNQNIKNVRNNIFHNERTYTAGPVYHCAVHYQLNSAGLTEDYNDFYVSPTGFIGRLGPPTPVVVIATLSAWQATLGQNAHSISDNPDFANGGGFLPGDYIPANIYKGVAGTGISTDYNGTARNCTFTMGAFEVELNVGTPTEISLSSGTEPACQFTSGNMITNYATTAVNSTGFNWSVSNALAGTINPLTGEMIWAAGFSGSVDIRVTANGCNGPSAMVIRNVTISSSAETPTAISIAAGAEPICVTSGTETTTYATTSANSTGFNWSVSNALAGTINPLTGEMIWAAGFSGSVDIRVTANGCNGPSAMVIRNVTISSSAETPAAISIAAGAEPICVTSGTETTNYATTSANSTGFNWSVSNPLAGTINPSTGEMIWAAGFSGSVDIRVTANGCNGPSAMVIRQVIVGDIPSPSILPDQSNVCEGTSGYVYITEPLMTGYTWSVSAGGAITNGTGTNAITVTWNNAGAGTVSVNYTNENGCTTASPSVLNVSVNSLPVATITGPNDICTGASGVTYVTEPGMVSYSWTIPAGAEVLSGGTPVSNTISVTWNTPGDHVLGVGYTNIVGCATASQAVIHVMAEPQLPVGVAIEASANPVEEGSVVTFTATPTNGGSLPFFQWKINGINAGTNSNTYSYIPVNGDIISCELISSAACTTGSPAESNQVAVLILTTKTLNIHVLFEGLYSGGGMMNQAYDAIGLHFAAGVADQLTIELCNPASGVVEYTLSNMNINTSGNVTGIIPAVFNGSYYIYIRHRNSIATSTANPVSFAGSTINYDFVAGAALAYGSNMKNIDGVAVIYGGDVNQDGSVDIADMTPVDNDAAGFVSGYIPTDVNGDGSVDTADMTIVDNNAAAFVWAFVPF